MRALGAYLLWHVWKARQQEWTTLANRRCALLAEMMLFARQQSNSKSTYLIKESKAAYLSFLFLSMSLVIPHAMAEDAVSVKKIDHLSDQIFANELEIFQHGIELKLHGEGKKL